MQMGRRAKFLSLAFLLLFAGGVLPLHAALAASDPQEAARQKHAAKKAAETGEHISKKDATHVVSTSSAYIGIDPFYTTIFVGDRISGTLMLGIGLNVEDQALRDKVTLMLPVMRDLYVRTMLAYASVSVRPWRKPDPDAIASRLQIVTDRKLKVKGGAKILLAQLAIRLKE